MTAVPDCSPVHLDSLGLRTDLALLRLGGSEITDRGDHLVVRSPHNPDHWWGNFLLLRAAPDETTVDRWLGRFTVEFPDAAHRTFAVDGTDGTVGDLSAFAARGFTVEAQTVLTAGVVHPPRRHDPTAEYRTLTSDDDWAQSAELRFVCDDSPDRELHRRFVTARTATQRRLVAAGTGAWFGAFVDGRLVSQLGLLRTGPGQARYQSVETHPEFRRRGLAGRLVHDAGRYGLDRLGVTTLVIVADPDYVAIDLYRSIGFRDTERQCQAERTG